MVRVEDLLYSCLEAGPDRAQQLEKLCEEHPAEAAALRQMFGELEQLGFLGAGQDGHELAGIPDAIGNYRIEGLIGRGGMGLVYRGRQTSLGDRPVAIKMIRPELVADARAEARFLREALLASKLDHPNLCSVLDVGRHAGVPYLVMPLVEGQTLAEHIAQVAPHGRMQLPGGDGGVWWERVVQLVEVLALGLHAAHEKGLVHRDVKPANVMVRGDGQPVLLDFGLAVAAAEDSTQLTLTNEVLGTPAYMAPEQVSPRGRAADARTDVHALGVLLFECLTLQLPYAVATREELARRIVEDPPSDIRRRVPALPRDLAVVVHVALAKRPDQRYATARLLAEDLARVRANQPIVAKRAGVAERTVRWIARNPWPTAAGVVLAVGLVVSLWLLGSLHRQETSARAMALVGASQVTAGLDQSLSMELALQACTVQTRPETQAQLAAAIRGMHELGILKGFAADLAAAAFTADGGIVVVGKEGVVVTADASGHELARVALGAAVDQAVAVDSDDGPLLLMACSDGRVLLRHADGTIAPLADFAEPTGRRYTACPCLSRDGRAVLIADRGGRASVASFPEGKVQRRLELEVAEMGFTAGAFVGERGVLLGTKRGGLRLWREGQEPELSFQHPGKSMILGVVVDAAGERAVAAAYGVPEILACDLVAGGSHQLEAQPLGVNALVGAPDGSGFASGGGDGSIGWWQFGESWPRRVLQGHRSYAAALSFSADGHRLVSGADDNMVRLWDSTGRLLVTFPGHVAGVTALAFDARGGRIISCSSDRTARIWRVAEAIPKLEVPLRHALTFGWICLGRDPGSVWLGDPATGMVWCGNWNTGHLTSLPNTRSDQTARQIGVDAAETRVLIARENMVELFDLHTGERICGQQVENLKHDFVGAALFGDGIRVVTVEDGGMQLPPLLNLWDVSSGSFRLLNRRELEAWQKPGVGYLNKADLSPDERAVTVTRGDGTVRIYDLQGNPLSESIDHCKAARVPAHRAVLSRDGLLLLTTGWDGRVKLWAKREDGSWRDRVLTAFEGKVRTAAFDADERRVVVGSDDGVLRVLDLEGRLLQQYVHAGGQILCVRFSGDGTRLLATTSDGTLQQWPLQLGELQALAKRLRIRELNPVERAGYAEMLDGGR